MALLYEKTVSKSRTKCEEIVKNKNSRKGRDTQTPFSALRGKMERGGQFEFIVKNPEEESKKPDVKKGGEA